MKQNRTYCQQKKTLPGKSNCFFSLCSFALRAFLVFPKIATSDNEKSFAFHQIVDNFVAIHTSCFQYLFSLTHLITHNGVQNGHFWHFIESVRMTQVSSVSCIVKSFESIYLALCFRVRERDLECIYKFNKCAFIRRQVQWVPIEWFSNAKSCKQLQMQCEESIFSHDSKHEREPICLHSIKRLQIPDAICFLCSTELHFLCRGCIVHCTRTKLLFSALFTWHIDSWSKYPTLGRVPHVLAFTHCFYVFHRRKNVIRADYVVLSSRTAARFKCY